MEFDSGFGVKSCSSTVDTICNCLCPVFTLYLCAYMFQLYLCAITQYV